MWTGDRFKPGTASEGPQELVDPPVKDFLTVGFLTDFGIGVVIRCRGLGLTLKSFSGLFLREGK